MGRKPPKPPRQDPLAIQTRKNAGNLLVSKAERGKRILKIGRAWCLKAQAFSRARVYKTEAPGVQHLARGSVSRQVIQLLILTISVGGVSCGESPGLEIHL